MITAEQIVAAARACLGTPFRHQGRIPGLALDCAGLIVAVAREIGIDPVDVESYGRRPHQGLLDATLSSQPSLIDVARADMAAGDILLMRFTREPQHLAICAGSTIIHSWEAPGKVCEHDLDATWRSRIVRVYRFVGLIA